MPRRRFSRVSISSENSTSSDHSVNLNDTEELPDPGLPKSKTKEKSTKLKKTRQEIQEMLTHLESERRALEERRTRQEIQEVLTNLEDERRTLKEKKAKQEFQEVLTNLEDKRRALKVKKTRQEIQEVGLTHLESERRALEEKKARQEFEEMLTHLEGGRLALQEKKTRQEIQEVLTQLEREHRGLQEKQRAAPKGKGDPKTATIPQTMIIDCINKREIFNEAKKMKGATKNEKDLKEILQNAFVEEKAAQAEFEVMNKIYKPGECMKFVTVEIHPTVKDEWYILPAVRELQWLGARVLEAPAARAPGLLLWVRRVPRAIDTRSGGQVVLTATKQVCPRALYFMDAARLASFPGSVATYMNRMRALADTSLTMLVWGAADFCESLPKQGADPDQLTQEKYTKMIADLQMELLVSFKIDVIMVESPTELAMLMLHYTRAVAEAPYKKAKSEVDEQAEFYMRGDNRNCVTVDKEGNGLSRLWEQMVGVLPKSSLEVARALGADYKKPAALIQELESDNGVAKIADVGVNRTKVPGAKPRRIGPEFARKLHILFTAEDGNTVIE